MPVLEPEYLLVRPAWKPIALRDMGKFEILIPNLAH